MDLTDFWSNANKSQTRVAMPMPRSGAFARSILFKLAYLNAIYMRCQDANVGVLNEVLGTMTAL